MVPGVELRAKAGELSSRLDRSAREHAATIEILRSEVAILSARLQRLALEPYKPSALKSPTPPAAQAPTAEAAGAIADDSLARRAEWRVDNAAARLRGDREGLWSPEFSCMGIPMQLEFYPRGRGKCSAEGFCSLFLWCPRGVRAKYRLRVGGHWAAPECDKFDSWMGHGHSSFCYVEAQVGWAADEILVGVEFLELSRVEEAQGGLRLIAECPEAAVAKEAEVLHNRDTSTVVWRVKDIRRRASSMMPGMSICSPMFSAAGVQGAMLELYPRGIDAAAAPKDAACGLYLRCPNGTRLTVTLFVGTAQKGPIKVEFRGNAARGVPALCRLEEQIAEGSDHLKVGILLEHHEDCPRTLNL